MPRDFGISPDDLRSFTALDWLPNTIAATVKAAMMPMAPATYIFGKAGFGVDI